jgi:hypothetical protein
MNQGYVELTHRGIKYPRNPVNTSKLNELIELFVFEADFLHEAQIFIKIFQVVPVTKIW